MKKAEITYTVIQREDGRIILQKDGCSVMIPDTMKNIPLISTIEVDLDFEIKRTEKPSVKSDTK